MSLRDIDWGGLLTPSVSPHPELTALYSVQHQEAAISSLQTRNPQRAESWRYTKLKGYFEEGALSSLCCEPNFHHDGIPLNAQSASGLRLYKLSDFAANRDRHEALEKEAWLWLSSQFKDESALHQLYSLHSCDGYLLILDEDVQGGELDSLGLLTESTPTKAQEGVAHISSNGLWVYLARGAQLKLTERFGDLSTTAGLAFISLTGFYLSEDSQLTYLRTQEAMRGITNQPQLHLAKVNVQVGARASFKMTNLNLGADLSRIELDVSLEQEEASAELNGLYLGSDTATLDQHLTLHHRAPNCSSVQQFKGALGGRSRGVFTGRVIVAQGAHTTVAEQNNPNLILSDEARATTRPQLEIYNDQVECSHGATVGQLDADALFYLRARGLDEASALKALTTAFVGEVRASLGDPSLKESVDQALLRALGLNSTEHRSGEEWIDWEDPSLSDTLYGADR